MHSGDTSAAAAACIERIHALWAVGCRGGDAAAEMAATEGVIHVTAVGRTPDRGLEVIAIDDGAPRSSTDFFLLNLARARADAILTTGRILRAEPGVHHALQGTGEEPAQLAAWRREVLGKTSAPRSVVLTSGRDVDLSHRMFHGARPALVATGPAGAAALRRRTGEADFEIAEFPDPDLRSVVARLARDGCSAISIEAGPSSNLDLYRPPLAVDEIMLSTWEDRPLPDRLGAGHFLDEAGIDARLPLRGPTAWRQEESGRWSFRRQRRA